MVRFQRTVNRRAIKWMQPGPFVGLMLALVLSVSGCDQATKTPAEGQTPADPAGAASIEPARESVAAESASPTAAGNQGAEAGSTMSPEEISRHFKVKTTDAAKAAAGAVEAAGKKAEQAVDEATR